MKKKKKDVSPVGSATVAQCRDQGNLRQPGVYLVEITDHGIETGPDGRLQFWLEFIAPCRILDVGKDNVVHYDSKCRVWLAPASSEYDGDYFCPTEIRADVLLQSRGESDISRDPHGLIGRRLVFRCWHAKHGGRTTERWMLTPPQIRHVPWYKRLH
jgi:hypothetical protein